MKFPLTGKIKIIINETVGFEKDYSSLAEIPMGIHPGSFGISRKNHIHEGVDIYCNDGDCVVSMEDGVILSITEFTGKSVGSSWWNDTYAIMVKYKDFTINYGEVIPVNNLKVGQYVQEGDLIGHVREVLKKNKGRPMSMLHIEMYHNDIGEKEVLKPIKEWSLDMEKPTFLKNPTNYLLQFLTKN